MTTEIPTPHEEIELSPRSWLFDHIGRLLGILGGFIVVGLLAFLASLGFRPALFIIVFFLTGVVLIVFGGKIHRL